MASSPLPTSEIPIEWPSVPCRHHVHASASAFAFGAFQSCEKDGTAGLIVNVDGRVVMTVETARPE